MAMLIDDKAIMTDQDANTSTFLDEERLAQDIVLGSVHDGLRWCQSGLMRTTRSLSPVFQKIFAPDTKVKPNLVAMSTGPSPNP